VKIYTNISSKNQAKTHCKIKQNLLRNMELGRTYCKIIKYWRLPKILIHIQNIRFQSKCMRTSQNICAYQNICFQSKYMRTSQNICAYPKYLLTCKIFAYVLFYYRKTYALVSNQVRKPGFCIRRRSGTHVIPTLARGE
jgi:hypothetical protein